MIRGARQKGSYELRLYDDRRVVPFGALREALSQGAFLSFLVASPISLKDYYGTRALEGVASSFTITTTAAATNTMITAVFFPSPSPLNRTSFDLH
mmetsp:Transcript_52886/g.63669  ORF Transcript_52886/g.63669 Transcript_52886/m.63669 type:complete len:96 (+) Transcript_52886:173-460(+)